MPRRNALFFLPLVAALLTASAPADYTGPDRTVTQVRWERLVCHYQAVYDPPGAGWYGCTLELYYPPDGACPSTSQAAAYFTASACNWPEPFCQTQGCQISLSASVKGCSQGQPGCTGVPYTVTHPPATVSGSVVCDVPGQGGWCRGGARLSLTADEPLAGESILSIEGTRNGEAFACPGAACEVPLVEGDNAFTFWAHSTWGDTSEMGSASGRLDSRPPVISGQASGTAGANGWFLSEVTVQAAASDPSPGSGVASLEASLDGGAWSAVSGPLTVSGDGLHTLDLRAYDGAGNVATQSLSLAIDGSPPVVSLTAGATVFCAACGESLGLEMAVEDAVSGVASWTLSVGGVTLAAGEGSSAQSLTWDGGGLAPGAYTLRLAAQDGAGNTAEARLGVDLLAPTATPTPVPTATSPPPKPTPPPNRREPTATAVPARPSPTAVVVVAVSPTAVASAATPTVEAGAALPTVPGLPSPTTTRAVIVFGGPQVPAEAGAGAGGVESGSDAVSAPPAAAPGGGGARVLWGAAAAALMAGVAAYAYRRRRARREREARLLAEVARLNALQRAREAAWSRAVAAARKAREMAGLIALGAAAEAIKRAGKALASRLPEGEGGTPTPPGWQPTPEATPAPRRPPTPEPTATPTPPPVPGFSPRQPPAGSQVARWVGRLAEIGEDALDVWRARALRFRQLVSGHVSVSAPGRPPGMRLAFRRSLGYLGTRYNPLTLARRTGGYLLREGVGKAALGVPLVTSTVANYLDWRRGRFRNANEFAASAMVDFAQAGLTGLAAAGTVALLVTGLTAVGTTAPLWMAVAGTAILGAALDAAVGYFVDTSGLKRQVAEGLGAWPGIFRNAGSIGRVLGQRAAEAGERAVRRLGQGLAAWRGVAENARTIGLVVAQRAMETARDGLRQAGEWAGRRVEAATERARNLWQRIFGGGD